MMIRLAIALCLSLTLHGTVWAGLLDKLTGQTSYPVTDSGYSVVSRQPYWLNADQILFVGVKHEEIPSTNALVGKGQHPLVNLLVWDIAKGTITPHDKTIYYSGLCYSQGFVKYIIREGDGTLTFKEGAFGSEQEQTLNRYHYSAENVVARGKRYSQINCREYPMDSYPPRADVMLLEGHGYLGWRIGQGRTWDAEKEAPVRYYKDAVSPPVVLPLKRDDIQGVNDLAPPVYAEWANAYLLLGGSTWHARNNHGQRPKDQPYPVYIFTPGSGAVQTVKLPYASWLSGSFGYVHTRKGLVLWSLAVKTTGIGDAGLYLADPEKGYKKIIAAYPNAVTVSPDGCRIAAVLHTEGRAFLGAGPLKLIDLCQGGK
jgi:hypothetical protein